jgi:hypothetical protein
VKGTSLLGKTDGGSFNGNHIGYISNVKNLKV